MQKIKKEWQKAKIKNKKLRKKGKRKGKAEKTTVLKMEKKRKRK